MPTLRAATSPELVKIRSNGHGSKIYLAIRKPSVIYSAELDSANLPTSNDRQYWVQYVSGTGTLANVKIGMSLWVGTSAGARDLGTARIRAYPTSTIFYISYESEIDWLNQTGRTPGTVYLTVMDDFGLWGRPFRLDAATGEAFFDGDITYTDQHTNTEPMPLLGPQVRILWRTGATVSFTWPAVSGVCIDGSTITGYSWSAPGSSAASNMTTSTPTITWDTDGQYVVYCQMTASNGKSFMGCRIVYVYSTASMPCTKFALTNDPKGQLETGGFLFEVELYSGADIGDIYDRTQIALFSQDYYSNEEGSIGPTVGSENHVCVGWIQGETIVHDRTRGTVRFTVAGAQEWLKQMPSFPVGLEWTNKTATAWTNIKYLTPRKFIWHLLHWRTSATKIMDCHITTDTRQMAGLDALQNNIWAQMIECSKRILANPFVDNYGSFYVLVEPNLVPVSSRSTWPTVMSLTIDDFVGEVQVTRRTVPEGARVELSGVKILSDGSEPRAIFSLAPGHVHKRYGEPIPLDYLSLASQTQANELAGLALAWHNRLYDFDFEMPHNNRLINIMGFSYLHLHLDATDNPRGVAYDGNIIVKGVTWKYNPKAGAFTTLVHAEQETVPDISQTGDTPDATPEPPIPQPPDPPPDPPPGPAPDPTSISSVAIVVAVTARDPDLTFNDPGGIYYTKDFNSASPTWYAWNGGIDPGDLNNIVDLQVSQVSGRGFVLCNRGSATRLYTSPAAGELWTLVCDGSLAEGIPGVSLGWGYGTLAAMCINPWAPDELMVDAAYVITGGLGTVPGQGVFTGSSAGLTFRNNIPMAHGTYFHGQGTFSKDQYWELACNFDTFLQIFSRAGALVAQTNMYPSGSGGYDNQKIVAGGESDVVMIQSNEGAGNWMFQVTLDGGGLWTDLVAGGAPHPWNPGIDDPWGYESFGCDPTGQFMLVGDSGGLLLKKSSDYGATWGNAAGISGTITALLNLGDGDNWVLAGMNQIQSTTDQGTTTDQKTGNLTEYTGSLFRVSKVRLLPNA